MGSGGEITTGYEYFGGIVQAICIGPVSRLTRVSNGDTVIWTGDIDQSSRNGDGYTNLSTNIGTLKFYWGRTDQNQDAALAAALIDYGTGPTTMPIPSWRNICYVVGEDIAFGNQQVPPTLVFDYERRLDLLAISTHEIGGDAVLPEVIYDVFTNALYSVGIDVARVNTASFVAACETIIDEAVAASPFLDGARTVRDFVGLLLNYIDAVLRWEEGQIYLRLIRKTSLVGATVVDESNLLEEPEINNGGWEETWNYTNLIFTDRLNNWDEHATEPFDDQANFAVVEENKPRDLEFPFITRRAVAKIMAKRKGLAGGIPQARFKLKLMPSLRTLRPGDLLNFSFTKRGIANKPLRVMTVEHSSSENRGVTVEAVSENTRDESNDYVIPADDKFNIRGYYDSNGNVAEQTASATPRLLWLPPELKSSDTVFTDPDGFACCFERPNDGITKYQGWWTWDPGQKPYKKISGGSDFPVRLTLKGWELFRNKTRWLLRAEFGSQADADYIRELCEDGQKVFIVAARRLVKQTGSTIDQHQVDGLWFQGDVNGRVTPVTGLLYDIEVTDAAFASAEPSLETTAGQANYPTVNIYAGRKKDFLIRNDSDRYFETNLGNGGWYYLDGVLTNTDTNKVRWIKITTGTRKEMQDIADVTASTYDRDDTTMCPDGTYSVQWGAYVQTLYELYDISGYGVGFGVTTPYDALVADIDAALYAAAWGIATDDQLLTIEHLEEVFAFMVQMGVSYYNSMI